MKRIILLFNKYLKDSIKIPLNKLSLLLVIIAISIVIITGCNSPLDEVAATNPLSNEQTVNKSPVIINWADGDDEDQKIATLIDGFSNDDVNWHNRPRSKTFNSTALGRVLRLKVKFSYNKPHGGWYSYKILIYKLDSSGRKKDLIINEYVSENAGPHPSKDEFFKDYDLPIPSTGDINCFFCDSFTYKFRIEAYIQGYKSKPWHYETRRFTATFKNSIIMVPWP